MNHEFASDWRRVALSLLFTTVVVGTALAFALS